MGDKFPFCPRICLCDLWCFATANRERPRSCHVWSISIKSCRENPHTLWKVLCVSPSASAVTSLVPGALPFPKCSPWVLGRPGRHQAQPSLWLCLCLQETTVCDCKWCLEKPHFCWTGRFLWSQSQDRVVWKRLFGDYQQISRFLNCLWQLSRRDNSLGFRRVRIMSLALPLSPLWAQGMGLEPGWSSKDHILREGQGKKR